MVLVRVLPAGRPLAVLALSVLGVVLAATACGSSHTAASPARTATSESGSAVSASRSVTPTSSATRSGVAGPSASTSSSGINQVVPTSAVKTALPVGFSAPASFGGSVTAHITKVAAIQAKAQLPGEIAGPGIAVSIIIDNGSKEPIDLSSTNVTVQDKAGTPSPSMSASPADPFTGQLAAGQSASAVYVFTLAKNHVNPITIGLSYTTAAPVVLFVGNTQ